jgi:O-antigen/teichoic acid export membrane protein
MESVKLILSKLAGPAFLGLFNKADSLHRLPFWTLGRPVTQTTFRAMSKVQDDLDQTKYMFYRVITLLTVYILPCYIGLWWIAEPFIGVVYGEKWLPSAEPLRILAIAGFFYIIARPCGVLLMAQNRLTQEMIAQAAMLLFTVCACLFGLQWGLGGVSWGILASQIFGTCYYYFIAYRTIPTRLTDLFRALAPGVLLNSGLMLALFLVALLTDTLRASNPAIYLLVMTLAGLLVYAGLFFLVPIPSLKSEVARWRQNIRGSVSFVYKSL